MAVEFHEYLQTCELSEFCVNLQSSLKNIIDNSGKITVTGNKDNQSAQAVLPDTSDKTKRSFRKEVQEEFRTFDCLEPSGDVCNDVYDASEYLQNQEPRQTLEESSNVLLDESVLDSDIRKGRHVVADRIDRDNLQSLRTGETCPGEYSSSSFSSSKIPNQKNDTHPVDLKSTDTFLSTSSSSQVMGKTLNETTDLCQEDLSDVTQCNDHQRSRDDVDLKSSKLRQRQLSLPSGYSSIDAENSFQKDRNRRRRHSVRFADEIGEILTTTITIPSNEEQLIEAYSHSCTSIRQFSENYQQNQCNNDDTVDFSWGSSNLNTIEKVLEKRGLLFQSDEKKQAAPMFHLCFEQPSKNYDCFLRKLQVNGVCVESIQVHKNLEAVNIESDPDELSTGPFYGDQFWCNVKVKNMDARKSVVARVTSDDWLTFRDCAAEFVQQEHSDIRYYDTFRFTVTKPKLNKTADGAHYNPVNATPQCSVEFAVRYQAGGLTFWDNNGGKNYRIIWR